eukprot:TRINITY_DN3310_c0_g1_i3.p1 TRINITY_DN3310_c0_g1~~TRINITY_DN3310_c0_g1_i3.p1  ORF type:complete len:129 (-),score=36.84 TRINITY_DN3310_c0_g1_i3:270-656(-)
MQVTVYLNAKATTATTAGTAATTVPASTASFVAKLPFVDLQPRSSVHGLVVARNCSNNSSGRSGNSSGNNNNSDTTAFEEAFEEAKLQLPPFSSVKRQRQQLRPKSKVQSPKATAATAATIISQFCKE